MKYCPECGREMEDGSNFCMACGTNVNGQGSVRKAHAAQGHGAADKRLHCPQCGSVHFTPVVESTNNGGVAVSTGLTRRVGVTSYSSNTTHRNYWLCRDCGTKFRNLQNLKEELDHETKKMKGHLIGGIASSAIVLLAFFLMNMRAGYALLLGPITFIYVIIDIYFLWKWFSTKGKVEKMSKEKDYLELNCFSK